MTESTTPATPANSGTYTITDARGRALTLKRPGVLSQLRLVEALGATAKNEVYMGMVLPALYVASIDGEAEMSPRSKPQLEGLIQRLDEDGLTAVNEGIKQHFSPPETAEEAQARVGE